MERIGVETPDGTAQGRLFLPPGAGPWPAVVFYADAGGARPAMWEMGQRLADAGYAVIQPDFFWRSGPYAPFDGMTVFSDPAERARLGALMGAVRPDQVVDDTRAFLAKLSTDPRLRTDRIGAIGYCMGGRLAFIFGSRDSRVAAVAGIHAGGLVTDKPDSPHLSVSGFVGEVYLAVAEADSSCTPEHQATLRRALEGAGVKYELENYAARHGWAVPDFPVYDAAAAQHHWDRVLALFARAL
jgi:carboxymethylenebutenolidase